MPNTLPQRRSPRLKDYDYTQSGAYFVTLCTHQRHHHFGHITHDGMMVLSSEGQIAYDYWLTIPDHFPTVELDAFVVMPNHVHGILVLADRHGGVGGHSSAVSLREAFARPVHGSLSTIMRSYKSIVTRTIHATTGGNDIIWQGRFHDHIIRNEVDLNAIRQYILTNPARWPQDQLYGS